MTDILDRRLADDPPVRPESVMPLVSALLVALAVGLVLVGLVALWPAVVAMVPGTASPLAVSTGLFAVVLFVTAVAVRRNGARRPR